MWRATRRGLNTSSREGVEDEIDFYRSAHRDGLANLPNSEEADDFVKSIIAIQLGRYTSATRSGRTVGRIRCSTTTLRKTTFRISDKETL